MADQKTKTIKNHIYIVFTLFFIICFQLKLEAQSPILKKYWVELTDKNNSIFSIDKPNEFLSQRAILRRKNQNISISSADFPVNQHYISKVESFGAKVHNTSKWLNALTIVASEEIIIDIEKLPFVKKIKYVGKHLEKKLLLRRTGKKSDKQEAVETSESYYGFAELQNSMIGVDALHEQSFRGKGILVAVFDAGFSNVDIMPFFDELRKENRLFSSYDFVDCDDFVFETSTHGSQVLSIMAANTPNIMVGSAPDASYLCIKTEDSRGEYLVEECNWIAALEYSDSIGVDIINSSLGYSTFSDKEMDYTYENMDGKTSVASIAADIAFSKGMIIVNSVGNDGNSEWKYMDVPADAKNVLAVGATDLAGYKAKFSSFGPTADGRIKPDLAALGEDIAVASIYCQKVKATKGTSFSAPLVAGGIASLWSSVPLKTNKEILIAIRLSASKANNPDNELGYGIPDFGKALEYLR